MTATLMAKASSHAPVRAFTPSGGFRHWLPLMVLALAQVMVVLDGTVVNVALPDAQRALNISDGNRTWVVTAYALAFGGLLLLGGRISDYWGRKRSLMVGLVGFAAASAVGGAAVNGGMLFASRAVQGAFAALLAPAALSLISMIYTDRKERASALSVYGAVAGSGAAIGLLLGGVLTSYLSWRYSLFINVPIAALTVVAGLRVLPETRGEPGAHYDIPGAFLVTGGLVAMVYGFTKASSNGWASATTLVFLALAAVLLVGFVIVELRVSHPLLPMRIVLSRNRGGAFLISALSGAGFLGAILFITYYVQIVLRYSPVKSGLASLPIAVGVVVAAAASSRLLARFGTRVLLLTGALLATLGMLLLTTIQVDSSYLGHLLVPMSLLGLGLGWIFVPVSTAALHDVGPDDAGVASAMVNATQQVGGSLGTSLLNTFYASAVSSYLLDHVSVPKVQEHAFVQGYTTAFEWGAGILAVAAVMAALLLRRGGIAAPEGVDVVAG